MAQHNRTEPTASDRRHTAPPGRPIVAGIVARDGDLEGTTGLHWVAILFRVLAGLLVLVMVLQVASGLSGAVDISYGVLIAEALRLVIYAGLLWGAGDLADLFVQSHHDLRASRILLGRLAHLIGERQGEVHRAGLGDPEQGRGDAPH